MAKINGIALTEKGQVKPLVRDNLSGHVRKQVLVSVKGAQSVEGKKNVLVVEHTDIADNTIYTTITFTTSAKHPSDLKERKPKVSKSEPIEIEFEEIE